ncbi:MAG: hypothetical protein PHG16_13705 [Lachnospiraceae bacterium]|nr:hypothetical protein [Lachnospiraceae bacterium]
MESKKITALLVTLCAAFAVTNGVIYVTKDHKGPKISFSDKAPSYTAGTDTDSLLENVTAFDDRDKDVTGMVKVDSVTPLADGTSAKVTYIVKDKSNNITIAEQKVTYNADAATAAVENQTDDAAQTDGAEAGTPTDVPTELTQSVETTTPTPEPTATSAPGAPTIKLTQDAVTLSKGDSFSYYEYIDSMTDDRDSSDYLAGHINLEGDMSTQTTGTKEITYYIVDSDGNQSTPAVLTLTVQ